VTVLFTTALEKTAGISVEAAATCVEIFTSDTVAAVLDSAVIRSSVGSRVGRGKGVRSAGLLKGTSNGSFASGEYVAGLLLLIVDAVFFVEDTGTDFVTDRSITGCRLELTEDAAIPAPAKNPMTTSRTVHNDFLDFG